MPPSRLRTLLWGLALAATLAAALAVRRPESAPSEETDHLPSGRWQRLPGSPAQAEDERARLLSLPYSAAGRVAATAGGVVVLDRARVAPGLNLYYSAHAPEAILMEPDGRVRRRWSIAFPQAFPQAPMDRSLTYFRRVVPGPAGDLFALYQGGGVVRLDRRSHLVMAFAGPTFNDLWVGPAGELLLPVKSPARIPELTGDREVLEDAIVELAPDGRAVRRVSLPRAFLRSGFRALLDPLPAGADILHINTIERLDGRCADRLPAFSAGRWLISLREIDTVAVVDPIEERVVWAQRGPWAGQHEPSLLDDCRLLLFDNRGAGTHSRVVEVDPVSGTIVWSYSGPPARPLDSPEGGTCRRLPNGNTMIVETDGGRALEITPDGTVVWEFRTPHRAGRGGELVAALWDVLRLESDPDGSLRP